MKMKKLLALIPAGIMVLGACIVLGACMVLGTCMVASAAPDSGSVSGNGVTYDREAEAAELAIKATGIPREVWFGAEQEGKSVGEYISNSVMEVQGLDEVTPIGQGGNVIINGEMSNVTLSVQKPLLAHVNMAKSQAAALNGKVLNVVDIKASVPFETATVNFYMPGVTAEQKVQVYQYVDKQWVSVDVAEIREDHVVVDMTSVGVLAFIDVQ